MTSVNSISFNGSLMGVGTNCGYGYAASELIQAWQRAKVPVWWAKEECPISFSMSQPDFYDFESPWQYRIGYTPWESTKIPGAWPRKINELDEFWTTSEACREWFLKGGIEVPIRVLHHGINREHFPLKMRDLQKGKPFTFLHIGSETKRKGGLMAYEAFKDAFGDDPTKCLVLKGSPQFKTSGSNVIVINSYLTQESLRDLHLEAHAMIYPGNGEGFGLIPFQSAATGMPTLCTDWGGSRDYMDYCWPISVEKLIPCDYEPHEGYWAQPRYESLKLWMEYFADSPNYFFNKAYQKGKKLGEKFSWDEIARISLGWMAQGLGQLAEEIDLTIS